MRANLWETGSCLQLPYFQFSVYDWTELLTLIGRTTEFLVADWLAIIAISCACMFAASCAIANRTRRKRRKESPQSVVSFLQKMSLSGKPRNRSRSPVKRSGDRLYHSGEKDDRRNSKEKHISKESRNDEIRTPKMDAKPKPPNVSVKTEKHESRVSSIESKESRTNHNSTPRQSHSSSHSRTYTNPVTGKIERKFSNRCRLFIGILSI